MHKKTRWQFELMTLLGILIITKLCSRQIYGHFPWKGIRGPHAKMWNETGKTSYYKTKWETTKYQFLNNPFCARFLHFYNRARHLMNGVIFRIHFISSNIGLGFPFVPSLKLYYDLALIRISYSTIENNPKCMIDIVVLLYPLQCEFTLFFEMHGIKLENLEWRWKCDATLSDILMRKKQAFFFLSSISQGCCVFHM